MKPTQFSRHIWPACGIILVLLASACGQATSTPPDNLQETLAAAVAQTLAAQQTFDAAVKQTVTALAPSATPPPPAVDTPTPTAYVITDTPLPPEVTPTPGPLAGTKLTVWASLAQNELDLFQAEVSRFEGAHPDLRVAIVNVAFGAMDGRLASAFNAGNPPDVAVLSYNAIVDFAAQDLLNAIDRADIERFGDYLDDSKLDVMLDKVVYAVPWRRQACSPHYLSFALPKAANTHPKLGLALANFLNQPAYQTDNYKQLGWLPIRISLYDDLGLHCDEVQIVRLAPAEVSSAISLVNERQGLIQGIAGNVQLNSEASTAWVQDGEMHTAAEPLKNPVTSAEVKRTFDANGLLIGGLFVNDSPVIPAGNYAVTCRADGDWATCTLKDPSGEQITVSPSTFVRTGQPVGQPFVTLELGSFHKCWYLDSLKICINIG